MNYLLSHNNKIPSWDKMGFDVFHNEGYWLHRKGSLTPFDVMPDNAHEDEITARLIGIHIQDLNETITNLQDDLVNADVEIRMLQEQLAKLSIVEDIAENLLDPSDTRLADAEETIATKDAVILAQSERIKGLQKPMGNAVAQAKRLAQHIKNIEKYGHIIVSSSDLQYAVRLSVSICDLLQSVLMKAESEADNG